MVELAASQISGPEKILVRRSSIKGAFAADRDRVEMPSTLFAIVNSGIASVAIKSIVCDPLQQTGGGATAGTIVVAEATGPADSLIVQPGGHLLCSLRIRAPARPGAYSTTVRIVTDSVDTLVIPVACEVSASHFLGIACMLLGLLSLAVINVSTSEGTIKTQLHDALAARQDIHTWLETNPAPESRRADIEAMDRNFDSAIASLSERRKISVVDHRDADATPTLKAAIATADQLRHDLTGHQRGAAEISDLTSDWATLKATLQEVPGGVSAGNASVPQSLSGKMDSFLIRYRSRLLQQPTAWVSDEMANALDRIRLAAAAGENEQARRLAIDTRVRLRRYARALNTALVGYRGALVLSGSMVNADSMIRSRVARDTLPGDSKDAILGLLDTASSKLDGNAWLADWAEAHHQIELAKTALVRATSEAIKARFVNAIDTAKSATDTGDIDKLVAQLQAAPDHTLVAKQAGLQRVLELWRKHIDSSDATTKTRLNAEVAMLSDVLAKGDLNKFSTLYAKLADDWASWNNRLVRDAGDAIDHIHCLDTFADLQSDTAAIEASLYERPPSPEITRWDHQLDQIRLDMQRTGPDTQTVNRECMTPLLELGQRATTLSGEILAASIADLEAPALTRIRLARSSGVAGAVALAEAETDHPRDLDLSLVTPAAEFVVGRRVTFAVDKLDPVWGAGVLIGVDFGDHSKPFIANAEELRQGRIIDHIFISSLTANMSVTAAHDFKPGSLEPVGQALGIGAETVLVAPSPQTRLQRLSDDLLNLKFAFSLAIALIVYYWRYSNKTAIFGANGYDYVAAFVLGFAANAAVEKLPDVLAKL